MVAKVKRREFIKLILGALAGSWLNCGGGGNSGVSSLAPAPYTPAPSTPIAPKTIKFGLGMDPERMVDVYDPDGKRVLDAIKPNILCMWINGARDYQGRIYSPSMQYVREWANKGRFQEWSGMGYELMVITWENYDGQNPALGPATYGDYHISSQFLEDLRELLSYLVLQFKNKIYFALATEQSTYSACRYDRTCQDPYAYSDRINSTTQEYFGPLRDNLQRAVGLIRAQMPSADVGICFGGWLVEFDEGINFIKYFEPVITSSSAIFFQSMMGIKASENSGYGNPERILKNCQFFSAYGKPIHLAHYMPSSKRADVVAEDMDRMSKPDYLRQLVQYLSSFSFMDYGLLKDNAYGCLDATVRFRQSLRAIL